MQKPHNKKDNDIKDVNFHETNIDWNKVKDITEVKIKEIWRAENNPIMETEELVKLFQEISLENLPKKKRGKEKGIPWEIRTIINRIKMLKREKKKVKSKKKKR